MLNLRFDMKFAWYIKNQSLRTDARLVKLLADLEAGGAAVYEVRCASDVESGTDALLSFGGDGTFLSASHIALQADIPVAGVNLGRLGFLSGNNPDEFAGILMNGPCNIETREMLRVSSEELGRDVWPFALNETTVMRSAASMLGIDVEIDGTKLPTYWADGLLVATSSGSTAYSLSVGGPICSPDARVFIVSPVSPHNLNVRPLIIPASSKVSISFRSREDSVLFTLDNRNYIIPASSKLNVVAASQPLKLLSPGGSNFYNALRSRLLWGEDVRNSNDR